MGASTAVPSEVFCKLAAGFDKLPLVVQDDRRELARKFREMYSSGRVGSDGDFNDGDLDCYEQLATLGIAKRCGWCGGMFTTDWEVAEHGPKTGCDDYAELKLLSLTQPWATLCALGLKTIETRSWGTPHRGLVAIHATRGFPAEANRFAAQLSSEGLIPAASKLPFGQIVAVVCLLDVVDTEDMLEGSPHVLGRDAEKERRFGDYTPGRKAWLFDPESRRRLKKPFEYTGARGLQPIPFNIGQEILHLERVK